MDHKRLIQDCLRRLGSRYDVVCILAKANGVDFSRRKDICVVVKQDVFVRSRWITANSPSDVVDMLIGSEHRYADELEKTRQPHLVTLISNAEHAHGDESISQRLIDAARCLAARPARSPSAAELFRFQCQPYDLLRTFDVVRKEDVALSALVLSTLVQTVIDGFFVLNRIRRSGIGDTLKMISSSNTDVADAVRRTLTLPLAQIQREPSILEELVRLVFGDERANGETARDENAGRISEGATSPVPPVILRVSGESGKPQPLHALRAYRKQSVQLSDRITEGEGVARA